jgi:cellulose synthase (UDP-forming)
MERSVKKLLWFSTALVFLSLATEPVGVRSQFVLALSMLVGMAVIRATGAGGVWRQIFLAFGTAVVVRYFFWRSVNTLPPLSDPWNFVPGVLLYVAELYSTMMLAISLFVVSDPLDRAPPLPVAPENLPTVDIYIPTYNEDPELLAMTVVAATDMDYPKDKFTVWLLDDGGTDQKCNQDNPKKAKEARERRVELTALAAELGAKYLTRARNEHAKAGNMNNCFKQSTAELICVFDADHVPVREFLNRTVGYFREDPKLFLCQTPHFFTNPDPLERNLETFQTMPSENEMFYGVIQKGLDKWNGAFFCGSAAVIRREALEAVGGFSGITITEDCETALDLHSRGWNSMYVDKPMISGLQPETFASFIGQRSRWARGMFQIFLLKNPILKRGLSVAQKICYLSNMTYWFFPIFRLPFLVSPLLFIYFNMQIYIANMQEFISYTAIYMIANMMMQNYLYGQVRWALVSEVYEYVQTIYLARGLLSVVMNPYKPTFNVTDKGNSLDKDHLSELSTPFFVLFAVYFVSAIVCAVRWFTEREANELLAVVGMWNLFNLLMSAAALGVVSERRAFRAPLDRPVDLAIGSAILPGTAVDVSYGGCRVNVPADRMMQPILPGAPAVVDVRMRSGQGAQSFPVVVSNVTTRDDVVEIGFVFGKLRRRHYQAIGDLMFGDVEAIAAFRLGRRRRRGIHHGVSMFFIWSFMGFKRGASLLAVEWRARRLAKAPPAPALAPASPAELAPVELAPVDARETPPARVANG